MTTGLVPPPAYGPASLARGVRPTGGTRPTPAASGAGPAVVSSLRVGLLVAGAALGSLAWGVPLESVGVALALLVLVITVVVALPLSPRRAFAPLLLAVAFLPWLAVRASPWVVSLDVVAAAVGVLGALTFASGGSCWESARGLMRRAWHVVEGSWLAWGPAGRQVRVVARDHGARGSALLAWLPAIVVTALLMGLVTLLLSTGDALFASFVDVGGLFDALPGRLLLGRRRCRRVRRPPRHRPRGPA